MIEFFTLPKGEAVLVDTLGAQAVRIFEHGRENTGDSVPGVIVELGGRLNKLPDRHLTSYALPPETAGQLCGEIARAVALCGDPDLMEAFNAGLAAVKADES